MSNPSPEFQDDANGSTDSLEINKETLLDLNDVEASDAEQVKGGELGEAAPRKTGQSKTYTL